MPALRKVTLDDAAAEKLPPTVFNAIQDVLIEGADLVDHSTFGGLISISEGELIAKLILRLPIKKTLVFLGSFATLIWLFVTTIYPWLSRIQISFQ